MPKSHDGHTYSLNGSVHANFAPRLQEDNTRDLLSQFWNIEIFSPGRGILWKRPKLLF